MSPDRVAHLAEAGVVFLLGVLALLAGHGRILTQNTATFNAAEWHRKNDKKMRVIGWILAAGALIMAFPR